MKKTIIGFIGLAMCTHIANAETCTDFDDDFNVIEYECGTSLQAAIKSRKDAENAKKMATEKAEQAKQERIQAVEKARKDAEQIEKARARAAEKARKDAEQAEKERARAAEKARKDAEQAEKERTRAAEQARKDAERAEQKRIRSAEKKARKVARQAEKRKYDNDYWGKRSWRPFVGIAYKHVAFEPVKRDFGNTGNIAGKADGLASYTVDLQVGISYRTTDSNWEYGLRAGAYSFDASTTPPSGYSGFDKFSINGREYYIDAMIGYNIWSNLNLYGGLGMGYQQMHQKNDFTTPPPITNYIIETDKAPMNLRLLIGTEYWVWHNFGIFVEAALDTNSDTISAGAKFRF